MTNLLQFTTNVQPQRTWQLMCEGCVSFVSAHLHVLCEQQHSNGQPAIRLVYPPYSWKILNLTEFGLEIQTALSRQACRITHMFTCTFFFQQWPTLPPPKILTFLPEPTCIILMVGRSANSELDWTVARSSRGGTEETHETTQIRLASTCAEISNDEPIKQETATVADQYLMWDVRLMRWLCCCRTCRRTFW
jgi:hypothetical protein